MYIIRRIDQGGGYVAKPGSRRSYCQDLAQARKYETFAGAEADLCPENEVILKLLEII